MIEIAATIFVIWVILAVVSSGWGRGSTAVSWIDEGWSHRHLKREKKR